MLKKIIIGSVIVAFTVLLLMALIGYYYNYSEGFRVGSLIKLSKKGYIFKTWEGQIDLGLLSNASDNTATSSVATRLWNFSILDKDELVRNQIDSVLKKGKQEVKLYYKEKLWQFSLWGDTKYFVYKIEPIGP